MFGNPYLTCVFGNLIVLAIISLCLSIFVFTQIVNKCDFFFGTFDRIGPAIGQMINANDFCFIKKEMAQSGGGLATGMIFPYIISAAATWTRNRWLQGLNLIVCIPVEFLFGILAFYIGAAANNKEYTHRGNATVVVVGVIVGIMNIVTPAITYVMLFLKRKDVVRTDADEEEERRAAVQRFEMQVQAHANRIQQRSASAASSNASLGGRGGGAAARGGRGGGRGGGGRGAGPAPKPGAKVAARKAPANSTDDKAAPLVSSSDNPNGEADAAAANGGGGAGFVAWEDAERARREAEVVRSNTTNSAAAFNETSTSSAAAVAADTGYTPVAADTES